MSDDVQRYINSQDDETRAICEQLYAQIKAGLPEAENKVWHGHPVWFLNGNPIVGFSKQKAGTRLMFWSGVSFDEPLLAPGSGKFKDASIIYTNVDEIQNSDLERWLKKATSIQWDYKNIVKRKGVLQRIDA